MKSLLLISDAVVAGDSATREAHCDRIVWRTPAQPDFWYGNCVIFTAFSGDPRADIARARADHPGAAHCCLQWDIPDLPDDPAFAEFRALGFSVEVSDCLTLRGAPRRFAMPAGMAAREIRSDADWAQVVALQCEIGIEQGYDPTRHPSFVKARFDQHRAEARTGRAAWFGIFEGDLLVADMGIYVGDGIARYQSVETRKSHRGRGLCRALVGLTLDWARARAPAAVPVIVAEADGAPGRLYRACGFTQTETIRAAVMGSYAKLP